MGDATAEHAQLKLRRGRSQVVAGEIGAGIADDLEVADADAPDAAASLGGDFRGERTRREIRALCPQFQRLIGSPLLSQLVVERSHQEAFHTV